MVLLTKRALITGITGQDGSYLAEHLLELGYEVWGVLRGQHAPRKSWLAPLIDDVRLLQADLLDQKSLVSAVDRVQPDEVYNLGAASYVPASWDQAEMTMEVTGLGVLRLLEAIRTVMQLGNGNRTNDGQIRLYQASSSEMFGKTSGASSEELSTNEEGNFHPRNPYASAKVYGHHIAQNYRESHGMFCASGILFNHESPRRGPAFVTRKVSSGVARIKHGLADELRLRNLDSRRDWGFAGDYVRAMHLMLQQDLPADYVIGTERTHSVRDVVQAAFETAGLDWREHVVVEGDPSGRAEADALRADCTKARAELGWESSTDFVELISMMVEADLQRVGEALTRGVAADRVALLLD